MRIIPRLLLPALLLCTIPHLQAETTETWSTERCTALRQQAQTNDQAQDVTVQQQQQQQQLQQHCTPEKVAPEQSSGPNVIPVELQAPAAASTPQMPPVRVQHNSTLEWLGSSMLLVLIGFWLWMGRK